MPSDYCLSSGTSQVFRGWPLEAHLLILILTVLCPQPGDVQKNPGDDCTFFSCLKIHNQLISSVSNITCPDFNPDDCVPVSGIPLALSSA